MAGVWGVWWQAAGELAVKLQLKTAEQAVYEFRRLVALQADPISLSGVFSNLAEHAPDELPHFRELLQGDIANMNEWLNRKAVEGLPRRERRQIARTS